MGEQFTEIFIKQQDSVGLVLASLEEFDFRVRWPAVKLLSHLLANRPKDIQEIILVSPMGISKLMDLLSDSREVIRNDVGTIFSPVSLYSSFGFLIVNIFNGNFRRYCC